MALHIIKAEMARVFYIHSSAQIDCSHIASAPPTPPFSFMPEPRRRPQRAALKKLSQIGGGGGWAAHNTALAAEATVVVAAVAAGAVTTAGIIQENGCLQSASGENGVLRQQQPESTWTEELQLSASLHGGAAAAVWT